MNGTYYQNPTFPGANEDVDSSTTTDLINNNTLVDENKILSEKDSIDKILNNNKGANIKAYISFPNSTSWRDKIFEGTIEQSTSEYFIINLNDDKQYLIPIIYLDYIEFQGSNK